VLGIKRLRALADGKTKEMGETENKGPAYQASKSAYILCSGRTLGAELICYGCFHQNERIKQAMTLE